MSDWPHYKPVVTVADVLESGACMEGVAKWVTAHRGVISGPADKHDNEFVRKAANADGYGYGYGDGDGDGYGYGSGYGSGSGDGEDEQ